MSKNIINIKSINVSVEVNVNLEGGESQRVGIPFNPAHLALILSDLFGAQVSTGESGTAPATGSGEDFVSGTAPATAKTEGPATDLTPVVDPVVATATPTPTTGEAVAITQENLVAFLGSSDKYKFRTADAILKHFGATDSDDKQEDIDTLLEALEESGVVTSKTRKSDSEVIFGLASSTVATAHDVWNFLKNSAKYNARTADAIAKAFPGSTVDQVKALLAQMEANHQVNSKNSRRGKGWLFSARGYTAPAKQAQAAASVEAPTTARPWESGCGEAVSRTNTPAPVAPAEVATPVAAEPTTAQVSEAAVLAFITSKPEFKSRSREAMITEFDASTEAEIDTVLANLLDAGKVTQTRQRYSIVEGATTAPAATSAPLELNADNVLAFINSSDKYSSRTAQSIAKNFGVEQTSDTLAAVLADMVDSGELKQKRRRADGVALYSAA